MNKKAVYAISLVCSQGSHDAVYHMQLVEHDSAKKQFTVDIQYGKRGAKLQAKNGTPTSFSRAKQEWDKIIAQKTTDKSRDRVYVQASDTEMPANVELLPDEEVRRIEAGQAPKSEPKPLDMNDPELQRCLNDNNILGILCNKRDEGVLIKAGQDVFFGKSIEKANKLPTTHAYYVAAHKLGGEFHLSGYVQDGRFCAYDMVDEDYKNFSFGRRIQILAELLDESVADTIDVASYCVGLERKREAVESIKDDTSDLKITFMDMTQTWYDAEVCIFPSIDS